MDQIWLWVWMAWWHNWLFATLALLPLLAVSVALMAAQRDERAANKRRKRGGYVYMEILGDVRGEMERSIQRVTTLIVKEQREDIRHALGQELEALHRNLQRVIRMQEMRGPDPQ